MTTQECNEIPQVAPDYYIPKLEDFHVGFEFEYQPNNKLGYPVWVKAELGVTQKGTEVIPLTKIPNLLKERRIRVKFLDNEDLESLNYFKRAARSDGGTLLYYNEENLKCISCFHPKKNSFIEILHLVSVSLKFTTLFQGNIKSKNHLINVLKLL